MSNFLWTKMLKNNLSGVNVYKFNFLRIQVLKENISGTKVHAFI